MLGKYVNSSSRQKNTYSWCIYWRARDCKFETLCGLESHLAPTSVKISFSSFKPLISFLKRITYLQVTRLFIIYKQYIVDLA